MTAVAAAGRGAHRAPVRRLTVLYDAQCPLCAFVRDWLTGQRQLVPLDTVPAGSPEARHRFPALDHAATLEEITVVGDGGQIYRGPGAWIACLWALAEHRPLAYRLSTPSGLRVARGAVLAAAKYRGARWRRGTAKPGRDAYGGRSGWAYDPANGWIHLGAPACDSGCAVPD